MAQARHDQPTDGVCFLGREGDTESFDSLAERTGLDEIRDLRRRPGANRFQAVIAAPADSGEAAAVQAVRTR